MRSAVLVADPYLAMTPPGRLVFLTLREWMRGDASVQIPSLVFVLHTWTGLTTEEVMSHLPETYHLLDVDVPSGVVRSLPLLNSLENKTKGTTNNSAALVIGSSFGVVDGGEPADGRAGSLPSYLRAVDAALNRPGYGAVAQAVREEPLLHTLLGQCYGRVRHFDGFLGEVQAVMSGVRANTPAPSPAQLAAALQDLIANGAILSAATVRAYIRRAVTESQRSPGSAKGDPFASRLRELESAT